MKYCFYTLLNESDPPTVFKGFSNCDDHGNFLLFPIEFSSQLPIGTFLKGPTGVIRICEKNHLLVDSDEMLRLYYK